MRDVMQAIGKIAPDRLATWALLVFAAMTAVHAITSLALPFGWDQGMMASAGSAYVDGKLPYLDKWEIKGPASLWPFALTEALFGRTMWGIRLFDVAIGAVASIAFYNALRPLTNVYVAAWAALALYLWVASGGWFFTAGPDNWAASLSAVAVAPFLAPGKELRGWRLALSGAVIGCIGLMKPMFLVLGIAPLLSILFAANLTLPRRAGLAICLGVGAATPVVLTFGYQAWRGGLAEMIEVLILYAFSTYARVPDGTSAIDGFAAFFARPTVALLTPFMVLGIWTVRNRPSVLWPALGWLGAMIFAIALQGKFYFYQWAACFPPILFLSAIGLHALTRLGGKGEASLILGSAAALAFAAQISALPMYDAAKCIYYIGLKRSPELYYGSFSFAGNNALERTYNAADEWKAAKHIAARTRPDEGVFVWGNDATVRYLADRPNPTRFTYEMPLSLPGPFLAPYRKEAMAELRADPPAYFVMGINWWAPDSAEESLANFAELNAFVKQSYRLEKSFGTLDLYRLSEPRQAQAATATPPAR